MRWPRRAAGLLAAALLTGCASASTTGSTATAPPPLPGPGAVETPGGTWATVAMGQLGSAANTYWQLFYRAAGSDRWVDHVGATGTATNGGLDLAPDGPGVAVGVGTSQNLTFSPIITSADGGRTWTDGVLPGPLSGGAQAVAAAPSGALVALLGSSGPAPQILGSGPAAASWTPVLAPAALAAGTTGCGVRGLSAAAYSGSTLVLGAACGRPGVGGVIAVVGGRAGLVGPALDPTPGPAEVLALSGAGGGLDALFELAGGGHAALVVAHRGAGSGAWSVSPPLTLGAGQAVTSAVGAGAGFLVLLSSAGRRGPLYRATASWQELPAPPAGTALVAPLAGGTLSALAVSGSTLTSWDLAPGGSVWRPVQTLSVPILYGTSS